MASAPQTATLTQGGSITPSSAGVPSAPGAVTLQGFAALPIQQKLTAMIGAALVAAVLAGGWLWSRMPDYAVLFSNLAEKDGGAIIAALQQQNVPYKFSEGGGAILVPAGVVHDARLRLASQGLPRGGHVGFELMETQKLGQSQFSEQITYQRALEGELSRSIQSLAAVQSARVHLAIPKQSGFLRDEQKPSASVVLNLYPGRSLEPGQVAGMAHLLASSVPQLTTASVNVIDQNGNLLSSGADPLRAAGLDPTQLKYIHELEQGTIKRIESIVTPITGAGNMRAQVAADVDFSQAEQTAETYRPNQTPEQIAVRSQQTSESAARDAGAIGVPGALSNQPPVPATAPITSPPVPGTPGVGPNAGGPPLNTRKDATINYEVDKTIRHVKQPVGTIKRLSVAVVVNHKKVAAKDGKTTMKPLSEAELKQITDLVREAMGFSQERGDTLNIANTPFNVPDIEAIPETPLWKNPEIIALAKEAGRFVLFAALAAYLFFGVVRPFLRTLARRGEAAAARQIALQQEAAVAYDAPTAVRVGYEQKLSNARGLAKQDPKLVANVIKDWVGANER